MPPRDVRYYVIAALVIVAGAVGSYYWLSHRAPGERVAIFAASRDPHEDPTPARLRALVDTTARALGAPRRYILARTVSDSGRALPELAVGVPASFDDLRMIGALTDSLRPWGWSVSAMKSLKEKTTTIRLRDRRHECMYLCLLYRKELSH